MSSAVSIQSEEQFYELVQNIINQQVDLPDFSDWKFDGWPTVSIVVDGARYHSSLTPGLLQGFLDFQTEFYRAYAQIKYGSPNLQRLTNAEKKELELVFQISEGSSDGEIDISDYINQVLDNTFEVVSSMPPEYQLAVVIALIVGASGTYLISKGITAWTGKVDADKEKHREEQETERQSNALSQMKEMAIELVEKTDAPRAQRFLEHSNEAYRSVAKKVPDASEISFAGKTLSSMEREFLTSSESVRREREEIVSEVMVDGLKNGEEYISIQVVRVDREDNSFTVKADKNLIKGAEIDALLKAWKDHSAVKIKHHALMESDDVVHSQFISVQEDIRPESEAANS